MPFKDLATELEVDPSRISRMINLLEKACVVQRIGNRQSGTVLINPAFYFRGSAKDQHKALEMWAAHRPYNLVRSEERKTA
jgi:hypothetical protein